ncbi:MAG: tetratricopeptide repeat protein [Treponema sp.]|nr:tetratricopeptide repeat protein [Treponema sp.]
MKKSEKKVKKNIPAVPAPKNASGPAPAIKDRGYKKLDAAIKAGKSGNYSLALEILEKIVSDDDAPAEAWLLLGRTLHALGQYTRSIAAFNDYLGQRPDSSQGYFFMGRSYLSANMPQKSVPFLRKAHELHPLNPHIMAFLGMAYLKSKHSLDALNMFQAAVEAAAASAAGTAGKAGISKKEYDRIYRAYLNALLIRGTRLCRNNEYDLGSQMLNFVLENAEFFDGPFLRLELGRACRETGRLEEALMHYSRALEFAPDDRRIRWSRASILMALDKNAEAGDDIEIIRAAEPDVPNLPWNSSLVDLFMIRSFLDSGKWRSAVQLCRNYLRYDSAESTALIHALCAEALRNLKDFDAAHNHLVRAQEEEPDELQFWYADILVCWERKDWKALKKALRMAKSLGGEPDIIKRFSVLLEANAEADEKKALAILQNAVRTLGPEPELMYALGIAYLKLGFAAEASSWFSKTIQLKNNHEEAWLGEIAATEVLSVRGAKLGSLYNAYLEKWPDNFNIRRERAIYLIKTFEYEQAAAELEKLLLEEPSNQSLRRVLAYAYRKTGRYREAAVFLKALLRERPDSLELLLEYTGCLERAGGIRYSLAILEKAKNIFGESSDLYLALGILNYRAKKTETAFDCLRVAGAADRRDPRPYEWMSVMAKKNGDTEEANNYKREAVKRRKFGKFGNKPVVESGKKV